MKKERGALTYPGIEPRGGARGVVDEVDLPFRGGGLLPAVGQGPVGVPGAPASHANGAILARCGDTNKLSQTTPTNQHSQHNTTNNQPR